MLPDVHRRKLDPLLPDKGRQRLDHGVGIWRHEEGERVASTAARLVVYAVHSRDELRFGDWGVGADSRPGGASRVAWTYSTIGSGFEEVTDIDREGSTLDRWCGNPLACAGGGESAPSSRLPRPESSSPFKFSTSSAGALPGS